MRQSIVYTEIILKLEDVAAYINVYYMYIICILYVYYMYIICILYVYYK